MPKGTPENLIGETYGRLSVVSVARSGKGGRWWLCLCECGRFTNRQTSALKSVPTTGCWDCRSEEIARTRTTHGETAGSKRNKRSLLYQTWKSMRKRCADKSNPYYGGKGISVCAEWSDFRTFEAWAYANNYTPVTSGPRSVRMSIDRIDASRGYEPGNCEWVTCSENSKRMIAARKKVMH